MVELQSTINDKNTTEQSFGWCNTLNHHDGASVVDRSAGGARGPSLCNDLQQKQSFKSLDNVKENQDNDATSSKASHLSATSKATSVSEGDGFHRGLLRLRCTTCKSNTVMTVR